MLGDSRDTPRKVQVMIACEKGMIRYIAADRQ